MRLLPLLENDKQIAKSADLASKSFTRSVFRLLRVIRLSRDVLSGSRETSGMVRRALRGRALGVVEWMLAGQRRQVLLRLCIMMRLLPLLENDKQIVKFAGSAPKSFTRQVFRLLRAIRLLRDVLSGSCETRACARSSPRACKCSRERFEVIQKAPLGPP